MKASSSSVTGPGFSFGSRSSAPGDLKESRNGPSHRREGSIESKPADQLSQPDSIQWRPSSTRSFGSANTFQGMATGDTPHGPSSIPLDSTNVHGSQESRLQSRVDPRQDESYLSTGLAPSTSHHTGVPTAVNAPGHSRDHSNQSQPRRSREADDLQRLNEVKIGSFGSDLVTSRINAEEFSKAVATEVTNCLSNNSTAEEIELIIKTRLMSLLSPSSSKKRKNDEAAPDDPTQPNAKRVACQTCSKIVARPCDLK